MDALTPKAMSLEIIAAETKKDKTLRAVLEALRTNNWYDARIKEELPLNNLYKTLHKCKDEISMYKDEIILKGSKIIIPETLQQQVVNIAHQSHQGINKTIALLREKVWFKGMCNITEETVRNCNLCLVCTSQTSREPLQMSESTTSPMGRGKCRFWSGGRRSIHTSYSRRIFQISSSGNCEINQHKKYNTSLDKVFS